MRFRSIRLLCQKPPGAKKKVLFIVHLSIHPFNTHLLGAHCEPGQEVELDTCPPRSPSPVREVVGASELATNTYLS
jgi:hypothetical protein